MPRLDLYHEPLRRSLEKDGWVVTDDPFLIEYKGLRLFADLGAERVFFFKNSAIQEIVEENAIKLLVFNPATEEVIQWIS